jgi:hypothetical protein
MAMTKRVRRHFTHVYQQTTVFDATANDLLASLPATQVKSHQPPSRAQEVKQERQ